MQNIEPCPIYPIMFHCPVGFYTRCAGFIFVDCKDSVVKSFRLKI